MVGFLSRPDSRRGRQARARGLVFVFIDGVDDGCDGGKDGDDSAEIHDDFLSVQVSREPDLSVSGRARARFANLRGQGDGCESFFAWEVDDNDDVEQLFQHDGTPCQKTELRAKTPGCAHQLSSVRTS